MTTKLLILTALIGVVIVAGCNNEPQGTTMKAPPPTKDGKPGRGAVDGADFKP